MSDGRTLAGAYFAGAPSIAVPVDRSQFRALCRERPRRDLVAFVAGLEEARGRAVDRLDDGCLRVHTSTGSRDVAVRSPGEFHAGGTEGADHAVVIGVLDAGDPRVRDLDDLHRELCYAIDRSDARRLVTTHFDRDPGTLPDPTPLRAQAADGRRPPLAGWPRPALSSSRALAVLGLCVLLVGAVAAVGVPGVLGPPATDDSTDPVEPVGVAESRLAPAPDDGTGQAAADDYPAGIVADGTVDPRVVSRVHRVYLDDRPYTAHLHYREYENGTLAGRYTERIRVVNDSHYASRVATTGDLEGAPMRVAASDTYADGDRQYLRANGDRWSVGIRDGDRFLPTVRSYLARQLSVNVTGVDRTAQGVRVTFDGDAYGTETAITGHALVTEEGLVRSLRRTHELDSGTRVVVMFNTTDVGETTVEVPEWARELRAGG